jgi:hypothetical protein
MVTTTIEVVTSKDTKVYLVPADYAKTFTDEQHAAYKEREAKRNPRPR